MNLFIIDGIAPFFRNCRQEAINWSKVPFSHLEKEDGLDAERCAQIKVGFKTFCEKAFKAV